MKKIIHITDMHVAPEGQLVVGLDPRERLAQVFQSVNRDHADADLCVLTGDLTDHGDVASYLVLAKSLEKLNVPYRLLLGNHDNRTAFREVFPTARVDPKGYVQSFEDMGGARLIFLDTLDEDEFATGLGLLCEDRLRWFSECLATAGDSRVAIFMHHPPRSVGMAWFDEMLLAQPEAFLSLVNGSPAVEHIAFGHLHLTTTGRWKNVSYSCNRGTCHRIVLDLQAKSIEFVENEPAYDVMLIEDDAFTVHHSGSTQSTTRLAREHAVPDGKGQLKYHFEYLKKKEIP